MYCQTTKQEKNMVKMITAENINEVLNEVIAKLDETEKILACPGCSNENVGLFRNEALNSVKKTRETVENLIHKSYLLR